MRRDERLLNVALGVSALSWSVLGMVNAEPASRWTTVRLTIAAMNLVAGVLFLTRMAEVRHPKLNVWVICVPGLVIPGIVLSLTPKPHLWSLAVQVLFAGGGAFAIVSLLWLGRNFAMLPALRSIVQRGPYRIVRHPAYVGELMMIVACAMAAEAWIAWLIVAAAVAFVAVRIHFEERLLLTQPAYAQYASRVRYRLIPGVW